MIDHFSKIHHERIFHQTGNKDTIKYMKRAHTFKMMLKILRYATLIIQTSQFVYSALAGRNITDPNKDNMCEMTLMEGGEATCKITTNDTKYGSYLACDEFAEWQQVSRLILAMRQCPKSSAIYSAAISLVVLRPVTSLVFSSEFDLYSLDSFFKPFEEIASNLLANLVLKNIRGLEITMNGHSSELGMSLSVLRSSLNFFHLNKPIECSEALLDSIGNQSTFFATFQAIMFDSTVKYPDQVCPYVFKNAHLAQLIVAGVSEHFLYTNKFQFFDDRTNNSELGSFIFQFDLIGYQVKIDERLLHPRVFRLTAEYVFAGSISSLRGEAFKSSLMIAQITFSLDNLKNFFHQIGLEWLGFLNPEYNYNLTSVFSDNETFHAVYSSSTWIAFDVPYDVQFNSDLLAVQPVYPYPDSDACIFIDFPFERLLFPQLYTTMEQCTCTVLRLVKHYPEYLHVFYTKSQTDYTYLNQNLYEMCRARLDEKAFNACLNETRIDQVRETCSIKLKTDRQSFAPENELLDVRISIDELEYIIIVWLMPLACLSGFMLNLLIVRTIRKHKKTDLKEKFFQYMSVNSKLNCLYSFIYVFNLMNVCISENAIFCSSVYTSIWAQYFKIIFGVYLGETIKMSSNITYVLMTINRLMLVSSHHSCVLEAISKMKTQRIVYAVVVASAALNTVRFFQYGINESSLNPNVAYPFVLMQSSNIFLSIFLFSYTFFNYFFLIAVNTVLETMIFYKLRKELANKKHRSLILGTVLAHSTGNSSEANSFQRKEIRVIFMVLLNGVINLILRLPDLTWFFYYITFFFPGNIVVVLFCEYYRICFQLIDISNFFFILTFSTNFMIYYFFNLKFKQSIDLFK
jgi:hypothetical protein